MRYQYNNKHTDKENSYYYNKKVQFTRDYTG